ncbi:Biotin carboxyl carrier protein of acetyl-CoA carboxylase [Leuconostoc suionicum]|uniref:Biotin carboxyl carrier protein of acetyl-CoA carboxylase n=2 Tax=Leuconostoc suionicum TaxID=1511761 RepID=A0A2N9K9Q8_9LACO|nr:MULTISPECIES: biotin/lipoyl-containing protein [Leuconostoc]API72042.1 acetyl-CoA carboxylase biotin carboxyl carrier protein subunit [Leuconostoc suionicum]MCT4383592.1 acetyl-CoA carboxylase biotin carboxyl carrier protein subunit [Leuconostoc suionicum]MCT4402194.1 acetyl-CoA carboxylase biotin carboxyl carrier protein subunit [Leuconostoc suionicum]MDI6545557.1 acetyl-CoA carboxylase biotin carboxyl carrier protein subunit [Leuconostoc suionicum]MDI6651010.1 acetyl-CoA carboxylase bioti
MKLEDINDIVKILNENNLTHISFRNGDSKISISKNNLSNFQSGVNAESETEKQVPTSEYITSPTVGTFYVSSDPESTPFISVGQKVTKSTVVGIVEAMKMMTDVLANKDGLIAEILVSDGESIEYGQKLFRLS